MLELDGRTLTFEQFRECCLKPNLPAIIRHAAVDSTTNSVGGSGPSPYFSPLGDMQSHLSPFGVVNLFGGDHVVPATESPATVASDSLKDGISEGHMKCSKLRLFEVIERWRGSPTLVYVKDWHMQSDLEAVSSCVGAPDLRGVSSVVASDAEEGNAAVCSGRRAVVHGGNLYCVPCYLGPDWMDEFCRFSQHGDSKYRYFGEEESDYRFAYIGPPRSWTPLHFDVFGTYSWSLNVCGEKLWFFPTPEGNQTLLRGGLHGVALAPDIRTTAGAELWTVTQYPGDLVFVPSCYLHQVHNVKGSCFTLPQTRETANVAATSCEGIESVSTPNESVVDLVISINHNWCNEWCVERMVDAFCRDANRLWMLLGDEVRLTLFGDDVGAWHDHVENLLMGGTNWNFGCIRSFLVYRLQVLRSSGPTTAEGDNVRRLVESCLGKVNETEMRVAHCVRG
ncbi:JmjC domain [Trypanosoma brucei equiperdum]|uniref:JmjC domain n=1 Tax=Trypanosoma brucei equiperdum TaxID=630700 RepID=A0A3L6KZC4_9TRYP|nr:JmjC domain [Trypanosoma brucei equiperdum]